METKAKNKTAKPKKVKRTLNVAQKGGMQKGRKIMSRAIEIMKAGGKREVSREVYVIPMQSAMKQAAKEMK